MGVTPQAASEALGRFANVKRRLELRGEVRGMTVYDDFAHHPTAIRTTVDGLRRKVGPELSILAVFEPRSNTMKLGTMKAQLPWSLEEADLAFCHSGGFGLGRSGRCCPWVTAPGGRQHRRVGHQSGQGSTPRRSDLCMSNGGFGGIHDKLLKALA